MNSRYLFPASGLSVSLPILAGIEFEKGFFYTGCGLAAGAVVAISIAMLLFLTPEPPSKKQGNSDLT